MRQSREFKKVSSVFLRTITIITLVALCAVFLAGCSSSQSGNPASSASDILVNGRRITPAGTTSGPVGIMPLNIVISPDGKYAITTSSCLIALLSTLRVSDGAVVSSLAFSADDPTIPNGGLFYGLVFDPTPHNNTYTLYAAQGAYGTVAVLTLAADGTLTQQTPQALSPLSLRRLVFSLTCLLISLPVLPLPTEPSSWQITFPSICWPTINRHRRSQCIV